MSEQQVNKLVGTLVEHQRCFGDMSTADCQWVIQNAKDAIALFTQAVRNREGKQIPTMVDSPTKGVFRLRVDYEKSLAQMLVAGRFDRQHVEITEKRFPHSNMSGNVEFEACLFIFDRIHCHDPSLEVIQRIIADDRIHPWSPAKIEHLLSFAATFPEEQHKYPIVGLGSVTNFLDYGDSGHPDADHWPQLVWDVAERHIDLRNQAWVLNRECHFLAVRRVCVT